MILSHYFYDLTHLEAREEKQKYFRSFFGSNEDFKLCFRDLLTFTHPRIFRPSYGPGPRIAYILLKKGRLIN